MALTQRVVLVARSLQMGGVEVNTVNLANTLIALGHEVHIVLYKRRLVLQPDPRVQIHYLNLDTINRLTIIGLVYDLLTRALLAPLIRRSNFVWRGLYGGWIFRWFLRRLERRFGPVDKVIMRGQGAFEMLWTIRDPRFYQVIVSPIDPPTGGLLDRWYSGLLYRDKNCVCNSTGVMQSLTNRLAHYGIAARTITRIPNPIPIAKIQALSEEPITPPEAPYIVHVGRLTFQKNQQLLIRAYHLADPAESLLIVGGGQDRPQLERLVAELGLEGRVQFLGQRDNPYPWMRLARLFVLSSRYEGFGLVMAEALACGTPVVAVDCPGGVRDVLIEEQAELIAEPSVAGLAEKIRLALREPVTINPAWVERFDATRIAASFLALPEHE